MIQPSQLYILLPAFNEAPRIQDVIRGLISAGFSNIIVIDDGSSDNTEELARQMDILVVRHFINRGAGAAIQTGIELARQKEWSMIALMDADGQHNPEDIKQLVHTMNQSNCDLVIGSRFQNKKSDMPKTRILFNGIANLMTNLFCENHYSDSQSGLRLLNRKAIESLDLQIDGFGFCSEMLIKAERAGLKIKETPIQVQYTQYSINKGQDFHMGITTAFNFLWNTIFK